MAIDYFDVGGNAGGADDGLQSPDVGSLDDYNVLGTSVNNADLYGAGLEDAFYVDEELRRLEKDKARRSEVDKAASGEPDAVTLLDNIDPNPVVDEAGANKGTKAKSVAVDLGDTSESEVKASIAKNSMDAEVDAILKQAELEEVKRDEVVKALEAQGYSVTDQNSIYNKLSSEFKSNVTQLIALRRAQNRFQGAQPSAAATLTRNLISGIFGDPIAPKIDIVSQRVADDIKNFKGAGYIRSAMIKAVAQESPVFAKSRMYKLEEKAANVVRTGTKILLDNQQTVAARDALIKEYTNRNPDATGSADQLYSLALADSLAKERRDIEFEQSAKTRELNLRARGLDQELTGRTFRAGEATKDRTFREKMTYVDNNLAVGRINLKASKDKALQRQRDARADSRAVEAFRNQMSLQGIKYKQQWALEHDNTSIAGRKVAVLERNATIGEEELAERIRQFNLNRISSGVATSRKVAMANKKANDKFYSDLATTAAKLQVLNRHAITPVKLPTKLQEVLDGKRQIVPDAEAIIATYEPLLATIRRAEAPELGYDDANHSKVRGVQLSALPIGQVKQRVKDANTKHTKGSDAVGAYQFIGETLNRAMKGVGLTDADIFDKHNQDLMAAWLLTEEAGAAKFEASPRTQADLDAFQNRVAKVWAGIPVASDTVRGKTVIKRGRSYYAGYSTLDPNGASISVEDFQKGALLIDTEDPYTLTKAKAELSSVATERSEVSREENPAFLKARKAKLGQDSKDALARLISNNGDLDIFPKGYEVTEDGRFKGSSIVGLEGLKEMAINGNLNTPSKLLVDSYAVTKDSIDKAVKTPSAKLGKVKFVGKNIDYVGTMTQPVNPDQSLGISILSPVGLTTKFTYIDDMVNSRTTPPSIRDVVTFVTDKYRKEGGDYRTKAATEAMQYFKEVLRIKAESPVSKMLSFDHAAEAPLRITGIATGNLKRWLTTTGQHNDFNLNHPSTFLLFKYLVPLSTDELIDGRLRQQAINANAGRGTTE